MTAGKLAFDDVGAGPAVLLIHGHPFDRSMWTAQLGPLADAGFRVIAADLRGYGESPATPGTVSMGQLAGDLLDLLGRLEVDRVAAIGLSMGGLVAMELATQSDRAWALGLVATTAEPPTAGERARRLRLADAAERDGMAPLIEAMGDVCGPGCPVEVVEAVDRMMQAADPVGAAAALRGRAVRPDYRPRLKALELPVLVCAGAADSHSTHLVTQELLDCLPGATTLILPEVGHMPNLEAPDVFNEALLDFLRGASDSVRSA